MDARCRAALERREVIPKRRARRRIVRPGRTPGNGLITPCAALPRGLCVAPPDACARRGGSQTHQDEFLQREGLRNRRGVHEGGHDTNSPSVSSAARGLAPWYDNRSAARRWPRHHRRLDGLSLEQLGCPQQGCRRFISRSLEHVVGRVTWQVGAITSSVYQVDFSIDGGPVSWSEWQSPYIYNGDGGVGYDHPQRGGAYAGGGRVRHAGGVLGNAEEVVTVDNLPAPPPPTTTPTTTTTTTTTPRRPAQAGGTVATRRARRPRHRRPTTTPRPRRPQRRPRRPRRRPDDPDHHDHHDHAEPIAIGIRIGIARDAELRGAVVQPVTDDRDHEPVAVRQRLVGSPSG